MSLVLHIQSAYRETDCMRMARHCLSLQVQASEWDACAKGSGEVNPFLLHAFLLALEESGSAVSH